jgi:N-methylhydantoinase A
VEFSGEELARRGVARLTDEFDSEHEQLFTFKLGDGHEILMIRAVVKARARAIAELTMGQAGTTLEDCRLHDTRFYYEGEHHDAIIYDRNKLHEGLVVPGPAIVSEMDSTTVVLPGHRARVDAVGNLLIDPVE